MFVDVKFLVIYKINKNYKNDSRPVTGWHQTTSIKNRLFITLLATPLPLSALSYDLEYIFFMPKTKKKRSLIIWVYVKETQWNLHVSFTKWQVIFEKVIWQGSKFGGGAGIKPNIIERQNFFKNNFSIWLTNLQELFFLNFLSKFTNASVWNVWQCGYYKKMDIMHNFM